ncbi:isoprenoid synthase domain-containing protein [Suillus americanus]|nr:isoprenoid synthase domain-containing protein [Suillus americanus]
MFPTVTHTTTPNCEPSQFILPDLINDCHYPLRQSLHRDAVSRASDQWLADVVQLVEPEIREYLDIDTGTLSAVCYPDGDAFHLQVAAEFFNWTFVIDDWMEYDVVDVQETRESCILALRDPNFDTEQLSAKTGKSIFSRFRETAGPGCTERFIHGLELYFAAVAKQVDDRAKENMYDPQSYIALRRDLFAMKWLISILEFVARIDLPDEVVSHPVIKALEHAIGDHVALANDILSYNKEQSRGLDLQGAIDYAGQMCKDAIQRFESSHEEVDRQVAIYVEGLQNLMVGSLHWHLNCPRYDVEPDRIMKLLPKRPL